MPESERSAVLTPGSKRVAGGTPSRPSRARVGLPRITKETFFGRWLPAFFVALPTVVTAVVFWPGHMNSDTLDEVSQAASGRFSNIHAPLLVAAWHLVWPGVGPGWLFLGQIVCFCVGVYLILLAAFRPLPASILTALIAFLPQVFGRLALLGRDMWFTSFMVLMFGFLVLAAKADWRTRRWWLAATVAAAWLTLASRQNAVTVVLVAMIGAMAMLPYGPFRAVGATRKARLKSGALVAGGGIGLTLVLMAGQTAITYGIGVVDAHEPQYTMDYDLATLSIDQDRNLFPQSVMTDDRLPILKEQYSPDDVVTVTIRPDAAVRPYLDDSRYADLRKTWVHEVVHHPLDYLGVRWDLFLRQVSITRKPVAVFHPRIDPNPYGYTTRFSRLDKAGSDYVMVFAKQSGDGTVVHSIWIDLLICIAGAVVLLRRSRGPALMVVGGLAVSALTLQLGLFFGAMGASYRYEQPAVVCGLITLAVLIQLAVSRRRGLPARAGSAASNPSPR
jgi:hypothetical protein